jgi:hypothetical protein
MSLISRAFAPDSIFDGDSNQDVAAIRGTLFVVAAELRAIGHELPAIFSQSCAVAQICTFVQLQLFFGLTIMLKLFVPFLTACPVPE